SPQPWPTLTPRCDERRILAISIPNTAARERLLGSVCIVHDKVGHPFTCRRGGETGKDIHIGSAKNFRGMRQHPGAIFMRQGELRCFGHDGTPREAVLGMDMARILLSSQRGVKVGQG